MACPRSGPGAWDPWGLGSDPNSTAQAQGPCLHNGDAPRLTEVERRDPPRPAGWDTNCNTPRAAERPFGGVFAPPPPAPRLCALRPVGLGLLASWLAARGSKGVATTSVRKLAGAAESCAEGRFLDSFWSREAREATSGAVWPKGAVTGPRLWKASGPGPPGGGGGM